MSLLHVSPFSNPSSAEAEPFALYPSTTDGSAGGTTEFDATSSLTMASPVNPLQGEIEQLERDFKRQTDAANGSWLMSQTFRLIEEGSSDAAAMDESASTAPTLKLSEVMSNAARAANEQARTIAQTINRLRHQILPPAGGDANTGG